MLMRVVIEDDDWNARVGRNVQELRKARMLTQSDVAEGMTRRGLPRSQQTIVKIESGQRPVRLQEAAILAEVLEVDVDTLIEEQFTTTKTAVLVHQTEQSTSQWLALRKATHELLTTLSVLRRNLRGLADSGEHEQIAEAVLADAATVAQLDPEVIVRAAVAEWGAERDLSAVQYEGALQAKTFDPDEWRS